jgi:hypothetical protein
MLDGEPPSPFDVPAGRRFHLVSIRDGGMPHHRSALAAFAAGHDSACLRATELDTVSLIDA